MIEINRDLVGIEPTPGLKVQLKERGRGDMKDQKQKQKQKKNLGPLTLRDIGWSTKFNDLIGIVNFVKLNC